MSNDDDRSYLLSRERVCRGMAERASDPAARKIHLDMADRYAERAAQAGGPRLRMRG